MEATRSETWPEMARTNTVALVALSALVAFALRLATYATVLGGDTVRFVETDAWYHMRLVDALVRDFPHRIWFDPYLAHPGGQWTTVGPFFDWLIVVVSLILGGGSPDERLVNVVGAVMPAVIGALTAVPVYVIGRDLFSRAAGLWAAAIVGILPGDILRRSLVGFTDHHCAEVALSSLTLMFLIRAIDATSTPRRRLSASLWCGVSMGCYLLTWSGGALLVAIVAAWAALQMVAVRLGASEQADVVPAVVPAFALAGALVLPWASVTATFAYQMMALGAGAVVLLVLRGVASVTQSLTYPRIAYLGALVSLAASATFGAEMLAGHSVDAIVAQVARFSPYRTLALAGEAQPLMLSADARPFPLWNQFTTSLVLGGVGLVLAVTSNRRRSTHALLFFTWTLAMLLATVGQVRFSYYLAVNVALTAGYACAWIVSRASRGARVGVGGDGVSGGVNVGPVHGSHRLAAGGVCAVLVALLIAPNISRYRLNTSAAARPNVEWIAAMEWLRGNTPDPFPTPDYYYFNANHQTQVSSYGVLSWWDFGYWIIRLGHRVPIANPRQSGVVEAAQFLLADDETDAARRADALGARYTIVSAELMPRLGPSGQFAVGYLNDMAASNAQSLGAYLSVAYRTNGTKLEPVILYTPRYYESMLSRLYLAGQGGISAVSTSWVVTTEERVAGGIRYAAIVRETPYTDYATARGVADRAHSPNVRLVGVDPFVPCLPLASLQHFTRVYTSFERDGFNGREGPAAIQIFERR